jgi:hypothetical protein
LAVILPGQESIQMETKIEKQLPNGMILTADLSKDPNYPGIKISVKETDTDTAVEIVCVVEFDTTKPAGKELCVRAYTSVQEEPAYSAEYYDSGINPEESNGATNLLEREPSFRYQLLDRMRTDCDYYLSYGNRCPEKLWAGNEKKQIKIMKSLWNSFPADEKPEWLTWEQIEAYEKQMLNTVL